MPLGPYVPQIYIAYFSRSRPAPREKPATAFTMLANVGHLRPVVALKFALKPWASQVLPRWARS